MLEFGVIWFAVVCLGCVYQASRGIEDVEVQEPKKVKEVDPHSPTHSSLSGNIQKQEFADFILERIDRDVIRNITYDYMNEYRRGFKNIEEVSEKAAHCKYEIVVLYKSTPNGSDATLVAGGQYNNGTYYGRMVINLHPSKYKRNNFKQGFLENYIHELVHAIQEVNNDDYDWSQDYKERFCEKEALWVSKKIAKIYYNKI